jgi:hypothetical protein
MKLPSCHPSGVYNSEMVPIFLQTFCTSVFNKPILTPCASHHTSNSALTGRILIKFNTCVFFENLVRRFKFHYNLTRIMGTLHEDGCNLYLAGILLRMRNVSGKSCRENQNTHFMFNNFSPKIVPFMR